MSWRLGKRGKIFTQLLTIIHWQGKCKPKNINIVYKSRTVAHKLLPAVDNLYTCLYSLTKAFGNIEKTLFI